MSFLFKPIMINIGYFYYTLLLSTLYGHGQEIYTELGATVKQGDVIMAVGSTGNSTGPHLHFEVRKFGVAVDPIPYLQGDNTKDESKTNENTIINNNEVANVT